jgi:hypothetical protein
MRSTKKITLSASIVALGTVLMVLGGLFDVLDLSACALASLLVAFVYIEIGSPYTYLVWLSTSLLAFVFFSASPLWMEYLLVFGIYPILKAYIERLPRAVWLLPKLGFINLVLLILYFAFELIFGVPLFTVKGLWIKVALWVGLNIVFILYDIFLTVLIRFYIERLRPRFKHLLK